MAINNFTYSVSWSDFSRRSARPHGVNEDAQIHPEMNFSNFRLERNGNAVKVKDVDVTIALVSVDCWVVTSQMSNHLLKHEQGHYDILTICARQIYNIILTLSAKTPHQLQTKIEQAKTRLGRIVTEVDARYDTATNHSRNTIVQQTWDQKIDAAKKNLNGTMDDLPG